MKGSYDIQVSAARVQFKFSLHRNITIIRGKSATGKTALISMIAEYESDGAASGVSLSSPKPCCVLSGKGWKRDLEQIEDSFVFIDEGNDFVRTKEFKAAVDGSSNYYVIATRDPLYMLPYSVEEVYELKNVTSRYPGVRKFYSHTKRMYESYPAIQNPELVIVEDSNAGYQFVQALCDKSGIRCVSAKGKSNVINVLRNCGDSKTLVVADGAAFGPEMELVLALAKRKGAGLFLPESFEWLVLSSGLIKNSELREILDDPSAFVESRDYLSWERFFTDLLVKLTDDTYLKYSKGKLNPAYLRSPDMEALSKMYEPSGIECW